MSRFKQYPREVRQKCLVKYIAGKSIKQIAEEENLSPGTLRRWHMEDKWSSSRKETKTMAHTKITEQVADKQAKQALDEIEIIDYAIKHLAKKLPDVQGNNAEGIGRAISELLKTRGTYTGKTVQRNETDVNINNDTIYRAAIEAVNRAREKQG